MSKSYDELLNKSDALAIANGAKDDQLDSGVSEAISELLRWKASYTVASINVDRRGHSSIDRVNEVKASIEFNLAYERLVDMIISKDKDLNSKTNENRLLRAKLANVKGILDLP